MKRACKTAMTSAMLMVVGMGPRPASGTEPAADVDVLAPETDLPPLEVEVVPEMFQREAHRGWVLEHGRLVLDRRDPLPEGDRLVMKLGGMVGEYEIRVRVYRHGGADPTWSTQTPCECTRDQLFTMIEQSVDRAVDHIEAEVRAEQEAAARAAEEQAEREQAERERAEAEERERKRLAALAAEPYRPKPLGFSGIVATGVGAGVLATGIALAARGEGRPTNNDPVRPADLRPPGYALLGVGLGVLTAGVSMLLVDVVRCRKDRVQCGLRGKLFDRSARLRGRALATQR
ncbi:MAG: hypothetical protein AB1Z98_04395 [Nannocystaceae bacterium]